MIATHRHLYAVTASMNGVGQVGQMGADVRQRVADLLALEVRIGEAIDRVPRLAKEHADMDSAIMRFRALATGHRDALRARLRSLGGVAEGSASTSESSSPRTGGPEAPSGTLEIFHRLFNEAAFGYSVLHVVAHRHYDSKGEGNTADLAEKHLREYSEAVQTINHLASDVSVWDLSRTGQECQCKCPSCGLGVCLCSPHGTNTVSDIWRETASVVAESTAGGIRVRPPRANSVATRAGLRSGDVIVAIDDQSLANETWDAINTIQKGIGKHPSGEAIRFQVKRASGDVEEISAVRE